MSNAHFSRMPQINIPRTKMKQKFTHSTSFNFAKIVPIDCFEVLPGDSYTLKLSTLIRMTQPIVPLMDTLSCDIHAFFVPMRLVYKHTQEFFGENKDSAGYQQDTFTIPQAEFEDIDPLSVSAYLGKPVTTVSYSASLLKERAYYLCVSEWYRAQQVQDPFVMLDSDDVAGNVGHIGLTTLTGDEPLANICKKFDYFTSATISPQYGEEVLLPLGETAPVVHNGRVPGDLDSLNVISDNRSGAVPGTLFISDKDGSGNQYLIDDNDELINLVPNGTLVADLRNATAASVNQIRYAFQLQKYLERANFGSRYFEVLASHFGVTSPDARLQRPEYLGGQHFYINIQQVLSTAGATTDATTKLGQPGANSTTTHAGSLFSKGFVEHGFVIVLLSTRQESHKYCQGILREDSRLNMFDYYFPEFANLGDQAILNKEIMVTGSDDDEVFGYQEHWAEYRYRPDRVSGMLNPTVSNSEDYWTLADIYANRPSLNAQFIEENRENLKRVLVNGDNEETINDFIADFYFDYTAVRPMPAYTIPGLIDHFGSK